MSHPRDVVITGAGVVTPIGIGVSAFWDALASGASGIRPVDLFDASSLRVRFGGQITDFDPKLSIRPRKSLKVMSREIQLGFAAADLAVLDAGLGPGGVEAERFGVVFGSDMIYADLEDLEQTYRRSSRQGTFDFHLWSEAIHEELHPLWLLKHLPNMAASHIAIAHEARGPNNSIVLGDVSSLLAVAEAASVIRRGWADVMLAGGTGCRLHPTALVARGDAQLSHRDDFRAACRPFDRDRDGMVNGEGAGTIVLEAREHAERRGATIRGELLAAAARCEPGAHRMGLSGHALRLAIRAACQSARLGRHDIGHVHAHGVSSVAMDRAEARAIAAELGDVPVTAAKSNFGHLGAGGGVVELVASLLGLARGLVPATLNYETADPECPVNMVHGQPLAGRPATALKVNLSSTGQAVAVAIRGHQLP
ncbi:MAG: beta-ketoacyl-[acyl-carrier-protein] synthase family protein [Planctomycetes bacterium]|nr:beta-ketoacyl-[acyl-carrier-protein] synthase family protein [Planctomycetota bacterium]